MSIAIRSEASVMCDGYPGSIARGVGTSRRQANPPGHAVSFGIIVYTFRVSGSFADRSRNPGLPARAAIPPRSRFGPMSLVGVRMPSVAFDRISGLFEHDVFTCASTGEIARTESACLGAGLADRRTVERQLGRQCAAAALRGLGHEARLEATGPRGEPVWPTGFVGSITHCPGMRLAAAAYARDYVALGVDAEPARPMDPALEPHVLTGRERNWTRSACRKSGSLLPRLLFSAKESVFKCQSVVLGLLLDFLDIELKVDPAARSFTVLAGFRLGLRPDWFARIRGRYLICGDHILTASFVPRSP